jgi:hypothetical protein
MEGVATEDQIIVSPSTKMQIEDIFNFRSIPIKRTIKGFENIAECYEVVSKKVETNIA